MSRCRTPQQIAKDMAEIRDRLPIVLKAYTEVHDFAYSAGGMPGVEAVGGSSGIANSDPTGQAAVAGAKQYAVRQLMLVGRELDAMISAVRSSETTLERAWPRDRDHPTGGMTRHDGLTAAELEESISHCSCKGQGFEMIAGSRVDCLKCASARAQLARIRGWRARRMKAT